MQYRTISVTAFAQNCSLIWCEGSLQGALVDPGGDPEVIKQVVTQQGVQVCQVLLTHGHLDHVGAAAQLAAFYGVPVVGPQRDDGFLLQGLPQQSQMFGFPYCAPLAPDRWLDEGDEIQLGQVRLQVLHCPGHTPGHIVFYDEAGQLLVSGDVIFRGGVGRTDFPGGSHQQLMHSIKYKLLPLGDEVSFLPGHGMASTLGQERMSNPFLAGMA